MTEQLVRTLICNDLFLFIDGIPEIRFRHPNDYTA
jgi:hypothetical protein